MSSPSLRYAWFVAVILFIFQSLHSADIYVISVVFPQILDEFQITYVLGGALVTATTVLSVVFFPVWGYLFDRYSRRLLISITGIIWGATTWLNTLPRSFLGFFVTRTLTGIDNTPPSGIVSLISDYFPPIKRGKPLGLIGATGAAGALIGTVIGVLIGYAYGWRYLFLVTGGLGILTALTVFFTVKDVPRGSSEPELSGLRIREELYRIRFRDIFGLVKKSSMLFLCLQGFFGVFPWITLQTWAFTYMLRERMFSETLALVAMLIWLITMILGNFAGGAIGDALFSRTVRGRAIVGAMVVFLSALFIYITLSWPVEDIAGFIVLGTITSFVLPMAGPNVVASVMDTVKPEARSSAASLVSLFESAGSSTAPLIAGYLADLYGLGFGMIYISTSTWIVCGILFTALALVIPRDIRELRSLMSERAEQLR
ncbi:MAG: MFS transporter [Nitrososphaerota archaeon]